MNLPGDNGITPFHSTEPGCLWERSKFIRKAVRYTPAHSSTFDALPSPPSCKYYMNTGLNMLFTRTVVLQDASPTLPMHLLFFFLCHLPFPFLLLMSLGVTSLIQWWHA